MTSASHAERLETWIGTLETDEGTARRITGIVAETFSGGDVAVSMAEMGGGRWRVAIFLGGAPNTEALRALVATAAGTEAARALRFEPAPATDWVRESLAGLKPVVAGRFVVHGAHDRARVAANRIGIEIDAALAFGTGHHGTTRGCLLALDRLCKPPGRYERHLRILDVGTGSGVLAIAAARALRQRVLATDIDRDAVAVARDNSRRNHTGALVDICRADGVRTARLRQHAPFDVVFANILLRPLLRIAAPLKNLTAPGGRVVLSGLLSAQANAAISAYRPLVLERRIDLDGWATLVLVRRAGRRPEKRFPLSPGVI